ncbi:PREDICTED: glutamate receptor ionotropic, kainate 2-like [Nicrophorus vespilloides]|uniref:Glutamate receptor ionotropic, kainate 2-like n=1 Tax=Nicrophorus vespilloides TaxID=110193 RepID=A0ABM1M440_NICVS|nr:PREDICTED: glutamate receptor ionotropic, kainate 2-like [Nicrophorus vespilloides]
MLSLQIIIVGSLLLAAGASDILNVGGIFDSENENKKIAFGRSIDIINNNGVLKKYKLQPLREHIEPDNALEASQTACSLLSAGVLGIFGPVSEENSQGVQSVCDTKEIPHIETRYDANQVRDSCSVNFYPHPSVLSRVYVDIVKAWDWKSFTVLYENNEGLSRIHELLKMYDNKGYTVVVRQLDKGRTGNYRPVLKEVWKSGETHFVLDSTIEHLEEILRQAQQVGLMTNLHNYIITNMDMHTIDLNPYQYSETNITGIRFINPEDNDVMDMASFLEEEKAAMGKEHEENSYIAAWKLQVETALMVDAVKAFAIAISELQSDQKFNVEPLYCNTTDNWGYGYSIINIIKTNTIKGLTGPIKFDNQGFRSDFSVDIIELCEGGITKVGNWNTSEGLNITRTYPVMPPPDELSLQNKTFIVITAMTDPYGMLKESQSSLTGNDRFEGFGIDLIHELSVMEGFNYTFIIREDKSNGAKHPVTGKWSGMIGDLMDFRADLAITDFTITSEREEAVDFTSPFMNLGISILFKKPKKAPPNFFSFAEPFAFEVWLWLAGAYFIVSISLFIMGRLCTSEWTNPYPCIEEPDFLINQFSLRNSFWFTIGSLMQQGTEIAPIAVSTRMVAGMWWFFTLIMVSSYTANLAAFLTTENPDSPFTNVHELVQRAPKAGIKYGAKKNGATANFFRDSAVEDYKKIYDNMKNYEDEMMMKENKDGVTRAESEDEQYAFFMESTSIEYEIQRHCSLTQIGGLLDEKGYGIAMRKDSPYRNILSTAVLKLQESGKIADLKRKWWEERRGGGQCTGEADSQEAKPLNLKNVGGVFWVTVGGTVMACFMVFLEMVLHVAKESIKRKATFLEEFKEEIKFYFKFKGSVKPVRMRSFSKSPEASAKSAESFGDLAIEVPKKSLSK